MSQIGPESPDRIAQNPKRSSILRMLPPLVSKALLWKSFWRNDKLTKLQNAWAYQVERHFLFQSENFIRRPKILQTLKSLKLSFPLTWKDNRDNVIWCSAKISWKSRRIKRIHLSFTFTSLMLMLRHFTLYDK